MPILNEHALDLISHSPAQTRRFGARLGSLLQTGDPDLPGRQSWHRQDLPGAGHWAGDGRGRADHQPIVHPHRRIPAAGYVC